MGPHKYECINSSTPSGLLSLLGKTVLVYFRKAHPLQTPLGSVLKSDIHVVMSLSILRVG